MSISTLGFLLRFRLASARLLPQDRHRLPLSTLRFFSTSPSRIPNSSSLDRARRKDGTVSTKPHMVYESELLTPSDLARAINVLSITGVLDIEPDTPRIEVPSKLPPRTTTIPLSMAPSPDENSEDEIEDVIPVKKKCKDEISNQIQIHVFPCFEVFNILLQNSLKKKLRICGIVEDVMETFHFYNRPINNPESVNTVIHPLLLTGPEFPLTPSYPFEIYFDIRDADTDLEIITGSFPLDPRSKVCNRFMTEKFLGSFGSAIFSYAVFDKAVAAIIEICIRGGDNNNVYGVISASNTIMRGSQVVLFHREKEESVNVSPGELLPLSRSVVALPFTSGLNVRVELWNCSDQIARATAIFQQHGDVRGQSTKLIRERVVVNVIWV